MRGLGMLVRPWKKLLALLQKVQALAGKAKASMLTEGVSVCRGGGTKLEAISDRCAVSGSTVTKNELGRHG